MQELPGPCVSATEKKCGVNDSVETIPPHRYWLMAKFTSKANKVNALFSQPMSKGMK
jgi:hypothetical protein